MDAAILAVSAAFAAWMAGAIYYDVGRGRRWAGCVSAAWAVGVVLLFILWRPVWQPALARACTRLALLTWWLRQRPSHDRDWEPAVAVLLRAEVVGDEVRFENLRNFEYPSTTEFTPRYENRTVRLS